jgi:hypothetical protein
VNELLSHDACIFDQFLHVFHWVRAVLRRGTFVISREGHPYMGRHLFVTAELPAKNLKLLVSVVGSRALILKNGCVISGFSETQDVRGAGTGTEITS